MAKPEQREEIRLQIRPEYVRSIEFRLLVDAMLEVARDELAAERAAGVAAKREAAEASS